MVITKVATNAALLFIDLPYYLFIFLCSLVQSLIRNYTKQRKHVGANDRVLVTGAASGLGQQVVYKLVKLFPNVTYILWDVNEKGLEETASRCRKEFGAMRVHTFLVDLSQREDVVMKADIVRKTFGKVTILWNNAGLGTYSSFLEEDPAYQEMVIKVNLLSHMWTIREFLPKMIEDREGHIVTTCSALAFYRWRNLSSYVASKYGLRGFLDTLKMEMRYHPGKPDIKFSTMFPGFVETPLTKGTSWKPRYQFWGVIPMTSEAVAEEMVDGMLKEKEEVRIPFLLCWIGELLYRYVPTEFWDGVDRKVYGTFTVSNLHRM